MWREDMSAEAKWCPAEALGYVVCVVGGCSVAIRRKQLESAFDVMERQRCVEPDEGPVAAPRPLRRMPHHPCPHRVEIDITDDFERVGLVLDVLGAESSLEKVAGLAVAAVEELSKSPAQPLHSPRGRPCPDVGYEMHVVSHQAVPRDLPVVITARFLEQPEVAMPVEIVEEDRLPPVAAAGDMPDAGRLVAQRARHVPERTSRNPANQRRK